MNNPPSNSEPFPKGSIRIMIVDSYSTLTFSGVCINSSEEGGVIQLSHKDWSLLKQFLSKSSNQKKFRYFIQSDDLEHSPTETIQVDLQALKKPTILAQYPLPEIEDDDD